AETGVQFRIFPFGGAARQSAQTRSARLTGSAAQPSIGHASSGRRSRALADVLPRLSGVGATPLTRTGEDKTMSRQINNRRNATRNAAAFELLESPQLMSAGDLDPTFGQGGKLRTSFGFGANDIAVQNDGKIVMVGALNGDFAVARMNANGIPDAS